MEINYTIIIPHRNCPDLLNRCLASIPQREDIQIIVVDDNSDEAKKPSVSRNNVEVILLDAANSKGAGRARNVGLEYAKGKWLLFADADDYYTECLSTILDKYVDDDKTDIVYLNAEIFDDNNNLRGCGVNRLIDNYLSQKDYAELELRYGFWTPWSRMVKNEVVKSNKIRFDEIPAGNDMMFGLKTSKYSKTISVEPSVAYMYFKPSKKSQTDRMRNVQMLSDRIQMLNDRITLYKDVNYPAIPSFLHFAFKSKYTGGLSISKRMTIYIEMLSKNRISLFKDVYRYLYRKYYEKKYN